jgi:hypothetical protein
MHLLFPEILPFCYLRRKITCTQIIKIRPFYGSAYSTTKSVHQHLRKLTLALAFLHQSSLSGTGPKRSQTASSYSFTGI